MAEARRKDAWSRTSSLLTLIANCHRNPKKTRAFKPSDFDPFKRRSEAGKVGVSILKDVFIEGRVPKKEDKT